MPTNARDPLSLYSLIRRGDPFWTEENQLRVGSVATRVKIKVQQEYYVAVSMRTMKTVKLTYVRPICVCGMPEERCNIAHGSHRVKEV